MKISGNAVVSMRYRMKNKEGEVLEDIMQNPPVKYLHGSGNLLPVLEECLEGLQAGAQKSITISGEQVAGLNDLLEFDVIIDEVREATAAEIQMGKPVEESPQSGCGPGCCC